MHCAIDNTFKNNISQRITQILTHTQKYNAEVMAVVKYAKKEEIIDLINDGRIKILGENRVQDSIRRWKDDPDFINLRNKIELHFIGHLQKNKVKHAIKLFDSIDSVDSIEIAADLDRKSQDLSKKIPVMLQIKINERETQYGINLNEFEYVFKEISNLSNISLRGIMAIGPITDNEEEIANTFKKAKQIYDKYFKSEKNNDGFKNIFSIGMSSDWEIALKEGSNLIRIGSYLFQQGGKK